MASWQNVIKHMDMNKICSILSSIYEPLFQSTVDDVVSNQLNAKHDYGTRFRQIDDMCVVVLKLCIHMYVILSYVLLFLCVYVCDCNL